MRHSTSLGIFRLRLLAEQNEQLKKLQRDVQGLRRIVLQAETKKCNIGSSSIDVQKLGIDTYGARTTVPD